MVRKILLLVLFFGTGYLQAQITMTLQVPPSGVMLKPQLWNMAFYNNSAGTSVSISMVLSDISTGQPVLTGTTNTFVLNNGANQMQASDLIIDYGYPSPLLGDHDPEGYLVIGNFEACYTLYTYTNLHSTQIAEECIDVTVEPLNPPMLTTPFDQSTCDNILPLFTWLPPSPLNMFNSLSYQFKLVEVQNGQASSEAIQQNIPVLTENGLNDMFISYPAAAPSLDTSKQYAWQVIAKNNNQYAAESEIWTFKIATTQDIVINNKIPYIKLKKGSSGSLSSLYGSLKFYYYNEAEDSVVNYRIWNADVISAEPVKTGQLKTLFGKNFFEISANDGDGLSNKVTYLFELINSRNELWNCKFIYNRSNN